MRTKLKQSAGFFTLFLFSYFILLSVGCKKEAKIAEIKSDTVGSMASSDAAASAVTSTSSSTVDIDLFVFIPCANGGLGETAILAGPLHIVTNFTINNNIVRGIYHYQPQGISGTGDITGDKYQATGITEGQFKGALINGQYEFTDINNFRIIGQGPGNNFIVHSVTHLTINANGTVTTLVDNFTIDCK